MECNANHSIACTVTDCANHCKQQPYCSLNEIKVGSCESKATSCTCTECDSFKLG